MSKEQIIKVLKHPATLVVLTGAVTGSAGVVLGYRAAEKNLRDEYARVAEAEIAEAKRYYSEQRVVQEIKKSPEELLAELHGDEVMTAEATEAFKSYSGETPPAKEEVAPDAAIVVENPEPEVETPLVDGPVGTKHVFDGKQEAEDDWDYAAEMAIRDENPDKPFIIHHDEFYENETDFEQGQLTYYAGDDTLADDKDVPVPDEDAVVGEDALTAFGHGSKDKNVVYIRNERLSMDFEVVRSNGKYTVEVLGLDDTDGELQHSHSRPNRKFRMDRDD